jgi:threonine aldolase
MFGEAAVFLNTQLDAHFELYRKQEMQLFSKMRYISAQFIALLEKRSLEKKCPTQQCHGQVFTRKA